MAPRRHTMQPQPAVAGAGEERAEADVNEEPPRQGGAGEGQGVPAPVVPGDAAAAAEEESTSGEEEVVVAPPAKRKRANRIPKKQAGAAPQQHQAGAAPQQQAPQAGADPLQAPPGPSGLQRAPEQSVAWQNAFITASAAMENANQEKLRAEAEREEAQRERDQLRLQLQNLNNGGSRDNPLRYYSNLLNFKPISYNNNYSGFGGFNLPGAQGQPQQQFQPHQQFQGQHQQQLQVLPQLFQGQPQQQVQEMAQGQPQFQQGQPQFQQGQPQFQQGQPQFQQNLFMPPAGGPGRNSLHMFNQLDICLRNPCNWGPTCRNVHVSTGNTKKLINKFNNNNSSRVTESFRPTTKLPQRLQVQEQQQQQPQPQREQLVPGGRLGRRCQEAQQVRVRPSEFIQVPSQPENIYFNKKDDECVKFSSNKNFINKDLINDDCLKFSSARELINYYENVFEDRSQGSNNFGVKYSENSFNIFTSNARSIVNKKKSLEDIFNSRDVDVGIITEINTRKPPRLKGYHQFSKLVARRSHGISVYVSNTYQGRVLRVPDESEVEMVHILFKDTAPQLHVIGLYLDVERGDPDKVSRVWSHLENKINELIASGCGVLVSGDFNRPLNSTKKSFGTELLENWLRDDCVRLLNDRNVDTRYDPASGKGSLLDLTVVSSNLIRSVKKFKVDSKKEWTPFALIKNGDNLVKKTSDHCAMQVTLTLPSIHSNNNKKKPVINYKNPEGWKNYKELSDKFAGRIRKVVEETEDINMVRIKIDAINMELEMEAFGLIWQGSNRKKKKKKRSSKELKELYQEQHDEMNKMLSEGCTAKSLNAKIYKLKEIINGPKISATEPMCINNPETGELITDFDTIKKVSLDHNVKILTKNPAREEDTEEWRSKINHHQRIMNHNDHDSWELTRDLYDKVLEKLKTKGKKMFDPLNKAGDDYKDAIFKYMRRIINDENIPFQFSETTLFPIWKGKGSPLDLNMSRFIHDKVWPARLCDALVTEKMKPSIVESCPPIQIGGIPKSQSSEHLFTLKTWMLLLEATKGNGIFQVWDMSKFFDKESLLDAMHTLSVKAKVSDKAYRLWWKLNEMTRISVRTSVGKSDHKVVEDSLGQGSFGAALVSTLNIGHAVVDTFKGIPSTRLGALGLNCLILQDDISKVSDTLEQARDGCKKIDETLKRKKLSVNYDKSKFLVLGSRKFRKKTLEETKANPMTMGGVVIEHSSNEKYLGDYIHEEGCRESISATIKARMNGLNKKCDDIIAVSEAPLMGCTGNSLSATKLFEAQVIPALLHNCESWLDITETHIADLESFQEKFIRKLMHLAPSTPKAILHWDSGLKLMRWRIAEKKLRFLGKLMAKEEYNIAKMAVLNEVLLDLKGLAYDCRKISEKIGLPDVMFTKVSKHQIRYAIDRADFEEKKKDMEESKKCNDRLTDNPLDNTYMSYMPLPICRIYFKHRARSIAGVKINNKGSFQTNLNCRFCDLETEETQEHLEECGGTRYERRGLNLSGWFGLVCFWRRMMKKISTTTTARGATTTSTTTTTSAAAVVTSDGSLT